MQCVVAAGAGLSTLNIRTADDIQPSQIYREWSDKEITSGECQLSGGKCLLGALGREGANPLATVNRQNPKLQPLSSSLAAVDNTGYHFTQLRTRMKGHNSH